MPGLLDFLQSASNTAASNVSAPVDAINWLLRKAGMQVSNTPVMGSDWMQQKGFTRPVSQSGASMAGETMGILSPVVASAAAPQIARGLLGVADNFNAPRTLNPQAGMIRTTFKEAPVFKDVVKILDDGTAQIEKMSSGFKSKADYTDEVFQAAREKFGTNYDHFFRFTNNKDELNLARQGLLNPSRNHAENFVEDGLSVADGPHYGIAGYKYGYPVKGEVVGYGSDGEPLLDPKTMKVLSEKLSPARDLIIEDKKLQGEILKKAGLPEDYFNGVSFTNDMYSFKPYER